MATSDLHNQVRINIEVVSNAQKALDGLAKKFQTTATKIDASVKKIQSGVSKLNKSFSILKTPPSVTRFTNSIKKLSEINFSKFSGLSKLAKDLERLSNINKAPNTRSWNAFFKALQTKVPSLDKIISDINKLGKAFKNIGDNFKVVASLNQIGNASRVLTENVRNLDQVARHNITTWDKFAQKIKNYSAYRVISQSIMALQDAFSAGISTIVEYDQSLKDLKAITLSTDGDIQKMAVTIKEVASTTKFSVNEIANGMKILGQSGLTASESIKTIQAVSDLATGTLSDMAQTVDLVTTAMRVFNIEAKDSSTISDTFANAVNRSKLTIEKLRTAFNYVGPIASEAGVSFQEVNAALGVLANSGLRASTMGTGLRRVLAELVDPNEKFAEAALKAGITLEQLNPETNDFTSVVRNLAVVLSDTQTAFEIFGKRGAAAALALSDSSQGYAVMLENVSQSGTAAKMASIQMEGLGVTFKNLKDRVGVLATSLGEAGLIDTFRVLGKMLKSLVIGLTTLVNNGFAQFVVKVTLATFTLNGFIKVALSLTNVLKAGIILEWVAALQAMILSSSKGAAILGILAGKNILFGKSLVAVTTKVGFLTRAWNLLKLAFISNPIGLAITAITALVGAYIYFNKESKVTLESLQNEEQQHIDNIDAVEKHKESIDELIEKQKELTTLQYSSAKADLVKNLVDQYPEYAAGIVKASSSLSTLKDYLEEIKNLETEKKFQVIQKEIDKLTHKAYKASRVSLFPNEENEAKKAKEYSLAIQDIGNKIKELNDNGIEVDIREDIISKFYDVGASVDLVDERFLKLIKDVEEYVGLQNKISKDASLTAGSGKYIELVKNAYTNLIDVLNTAPNSFENVKKSFRNLTLDQQIEVIKVSEKIAELKKLAIEAEKAYSEIDNPTSEQAQKHLAVMAKYEKELQAIMKDGNKELLRLQQEYIIEKKAQDDITDLKERKDKGIVTELEYQASIIQIEKDLQAKLKAVRAYGVADIKTLQEQRKQAYSEATLQIEKEVANGVISYTDGENKKLEASRKMYAGLTTIAKTEFERIKILGQSVGDKDYDNAFKNLQKALEAESKNIISQLNSLNKEFEQLAKQYKETKESMIEEEKNYSDSLEDISNDRSEKIIDLEEKTAEKIKEIDVDLVEKRKEIQSKLNEKLADLVREREEIERNAASDIVSIEDTISDKIRKIKMRGLSEDKKQKINELLAYKKLQEGIKAVNDAKKNGDEEALKRGEKLIDQASSLFEQFKNPNDAIIGLQKVGEAQKKAVEAGKELDLKENDRKVKEVEKEYKNKLNKLNEEHKLKIDNIEKEKIKALEGINKVYEESVAKEEERHAKRMKNLKDEYNEIVRQIEVNVKNKQSIQNGRSDSTSETITPKVDNSEIIESTSKWKEAKNEWSSLDETVSNNQIEPNIDNSIVSKLDSIKDSVSGYTEAIVQMNNEQNGISIGSINNPVTNLNFDQALDEYIKLRENIENDELDIKLQLKKDEATTEINGLVTSLNKELSNLTVPELLSQEAINAVNGNIDRITEKARGMFSDTGEIDLKAQVVSASEAFNQISSNGNTSRQVISEMMVDLQELADRAGQEITFTWNADGTLIAKAVKTTDQEIAKLREKAESPFIFKANDVELVKLADKIPSIMKNAIDKANNEAVLELNTEKIDNQTDKVNKTIIESLPDKEDATLEIGVAVDAEGLQKVQGEVDSFIDVETIKEIKFEGSGSATMPISEKINEIEEQIKSLSDIEVIISIDLDEEKLNAITDTITELSSDDVEITITTVGEDKVSSLKKLFDKIKDKAVTLKAEISNIKSWQNAYKLYKNLKNKTVVITTIHKSVTKKADGGPVDTFAEGGKVFRRLSSRRINTGSGTKDDVPALLMRGEYVMKKSAVQKYGFAVMDMLNRGLLDLSRAIPSKYEAGGLVDNVSNKAFMVGRGIQLAVNPKAPFTKDGVTYNINAPSFHNHIHDKINKVKTPTGRKSVSKLVKSFAKLVPRFQAGGTALGGFQAEKSAIISKYEEDIRYAKQSGEDEVVFILENEKLEIEQLAKELIFTLDQIRLEYEQEMLQARLDLEEAKSDIAKDRDDAKIEYDEAMLDLRKERQSIERKFLEERNRIEKDMVKQRSIIQKLTSNKGPFGIRVSSNAVRSANLKLRDLQNDLATLEKEYSEDNENIDDKQVIEKRKKDSTIRSLNRKEKIAQTRYDGETTLAGRSSFIESTKVQSEHDLGVKKVQYETKKDVAQTQRDTAHEIRKLEIELQLALIELRKSYESMSQDTTSSDGGGASIKYWLNKGGFVGWKKGAKRRKDSILAMLTPGEYVINQDAVDHYGMEFIEALNKREIDPDYNEFPSFLNVKGMKSIPTTINGVTYHVNAPSFHDNLADKNGDIITPLGKETSKRMLDTFSTAIPKLAEGGSITSAQSRLYAERANIKAEYDERIRYAKETGREDLAYILATERDALNTIQAELEFTLSELKTEYEFAINAAKIDRDQDLLDNKLDYQETMNDIAMDKISAKYDLETRLAELQQQLTEAKTGGSDSVAQAKKEQFLRKFDSFARRYIRKFNGFDDYFTRGGRPAFSTLEYYLRKGKYGNISWSPNSALKGLADLKVEWAELGGSVGGSDTSKEMIDNINELIQAEKNKYNSYLGLLGLRGKQAASKRIENDKLARMSFRNELKKTNREYTKNTKKAKVTAFTDKRDTQREAKHDYTERYQEMVNEIRLLEIELAKTLLELEKQYSTSGEGTGVKYWLNKGGFVGYPKQATRGVDSVKAMLTPGEFVVKESVVRKFGKNFFDKLNNFQLPRLHFADGGLVPGVSFNNTANQITEQYLGRIDLGIGDKNIPVKADINLARDLVKEFRKLGMRIA